MSDFKTEAKHGPPHEGAPARGDMERRLNRFLLEYAERARARGLHDRADRVELLTTPRRPLPET